MAAAQAASLQEAEVAAIAAAQEESQQLQQERLQHQERNEREKAVAEFLKANGFCSVNKPKLFNMGLSRTYPLHKAVEKGDDRLVAMLLLEGADPAQKNKPYGSSGKTAMEVALKLNRAGSHSKVLANLRGATSNATLLTTAAQAPKRLFCTQCGAGMDTGARFCEKCGAPIVNG